MKKILKSLIFLLLSFNLSFAFAWTVDHFQVEFSKDTAILWESLDLTIKAVDKNNDVVTDYTWNVLGISQTDDSVELPEDLASDEWYSFQLSDQWVRKFENWVTFSTSWEHNLSIYDSQDYENLIGRWEITIIEWTTNTEKVEIKILTPESNTTLADNTVQVSGATKKNHQIRIELNNKLTFTTTSNADWIFEKEIDSIPTWENVLKAYILDSDENIIWESSEVVIRIDDNKPSFKKITLSPVPDSWEVEEWTNIDVKVYATSKLKAIKLLFNDWIISLSETENGIYTWSFKAPNEEKSFDIDVVLSDNLWHTITEKKVTQIKVFLVNNSAQTDIKPVKIETTNSWTINKKLNLNITWLKLVTLKTKSILTWDELEDAQDYDVYQKNDDWEFEFVQSVEEPVIEIEMTWEEIKYQYFAIKAKTKTASWETISWDLSEATKIQTWPTEIILMLLLSLILWFAFMLYKRKNA